MESGWTPALMPWYIGFSAMIFLLGSCIGSFLNVCIYRIPLDQSVVAPRSHCPGCKTPIPWYNNIPLLSWTLLRGKCADCKTRISPRYVLVELLVAVLFLFVWLKYDFLGKGVGLGLTPITDLATIPVYWLFISGLVLGTFVDFEHMIIPDRVTWGGMIAGLVISPLVPAIHGETTALPSLIQSAIGAAAGFGSLYIVGVIGRLIFKKDAMGFGDVKLLGAIGAFTGWQSVIFTIVGSSLAGSIVGITLVCSKKKELQSRIPYGPYLALAAIVWIFWGESLWQAYVNLLTPTPPLM